jgi:hypothetical protein
MPASAAPHPPRTYRLARGTLVVCLVAGLAVLARQVSGRLAASPASSSEPASEPAVTGEPRHDPPAPRPRPPAAQGIPAACRAAVAELDRRTADARLALQATGPATLFRDSPPNERATNELRPLVAAALGATVKDTEQRIECRGSLCRCQVTGATQSRAAGVALYDAAMRGALGQVDGQAMLALSDRSEPTVDPATGQRRFVISYWIPLVVPSRLLPPGNPPPGGVQ